MKCKRLKFFIIYLYSPKCRNSEACARKAIAEWVQLFAVVMSSAGLAQYLLRDSCSVFDETKHTVSYL